MRRLSGEEVAIHQLLDLVQEIVADCTLAHVQHHGHVGHVDPATRLQVPLRSAHGSNRVHFDDARKMAQAPGAKVDVL